MNTRAYYDRRNKNRHYKIKLIKSITGDSKLANSLRDKGVDYLSKRFKELDVVNNKLVMKKVESTKKVKSVTKIVNEVEEVKVEKSNVVKAKPIKETRNEKRRRLYKEARDKNYTPEEARALRGKSQEKFEKTTRFNRIIDNQSRYERWSKWGKEVAKIEKKIQQALKDNSKTASQIYDLEQRQNSIYPKWITDQIEEINTRNGFDKNASYGWSVVYYYYTDGGTLEYWESFLQADPLNPNIYKAKTTIIVSVENRQRRLKV